MTAPDDPCTTAGHALRCCRTCGAVFRPVGKARYCSDECRHGTDAGYNAGCREACCRRAHARARKRDRCIPNPHVPPLGTVRRVQALARLGWSSSELSRRLGHDRTYLAKVLTESKIEATTALKVAELYADLSMTWCTTPTAGRTAAEARAKGYPPPLAWNRIDDPNETPTGWEYTPPSRLEILIDLDEQGAGISEVCQRLGLSRDSLQKWCSNNGVSALFLRLGDREVRSMNQHDSMTREVA